MASVWDAATAKAWIMQGGPGRAWQLLQVETEIDAISGGAITKETDWAAGQYIGRRITSNPSDYSTTLRVRDYAVQDALDRIAAQGCFGNLFIATGCPGLDITQFAKARVLVDASLDAGPLQNEGLLLDGMQRANAKVLKSFPVTSGTGVVLYPTAHNIDATLVQVADLNDVIALRTLQCAGDCGDEITEDDELIAVGGPVAPATIPRIHYRARKGGEWKSLTLTGIADGSADTVTKIGDRILIGVSGTDEGLYSVSYADLLVQTSAIAATQVSAAVITAAVTAVKAVGGTWVYAVGPSGALYVSQDSGYSFVVLTSGTAQNLLAIDARDENTVYIGGAAGVLLKRSNKGAVTNLAPSVITGDDVTAVAVPPRGNEVFIGTDTGEIWKSVDGGSNWTQYQWTGGNTGVIADIKFIGTRGIIMFFIQTDATPDSRVLIDYSGGYGGSSVKAYGTYASPVNNGFNAIAPSSVNYAYVVGDIAAVNGFAGEIAPA